MSSNREQMNVVVIGHVDHGKSTVIGRLFADTGSLPQGKLEYVKAQCERNARPFEYAFLLDALKEEQSQGITIDTARCFFKTKKRDYIIIDAPGHIEFLKNMVSGAARAEAALLVIDAREGIAENSKRHGYLASMLGIRQLIVLINKMDLAGFDQSIYVGLRDEYGRFLTKLGVTPTAFVPISARDGDNLAVKSIRTPWYSGQSVLELVDGLEKQVDKPEMPLRFPVQDVYKFTEAGDDRRIVAGTIESGSIAVGEDVVFLPSGKKTVVKSIESFNQDSRHDAFSGQATGFVLRDELYLRRGEIMCKAGEAQPYVADRFRANVFWMGSAPLIREKKYKLKITTAKVQVRLVEVVSCIDATELSSVAGKQQLDRHDVAECVFETVKPIAFDPVSLIQSTGRFVIVDNYDIAGGGIILRSEQESSSWLRQHVRSREIAWDRGTVGVSERVSRNGHLGKTIVICGDERRRTIAKELERALFSAGYQSYYSSIENIKAGMDSENEDTEEYAADHLWHLGETSRMLTDAGILFLTALGDIDSADLDAIRKLNEPYGLLVAWAGSPDVAPFEHDLSFEPDESVEGIVWEIVNTLRTEKIIPEYSI